MLEPVRVRGSRRTLLPASGREELATGSGDDVKYFIESTLTGSAVKLRLMLSGHVSADTVLEFQARTSPAAITQADIHNGSPNYADPGVPLPILGGFVESVFLPLATDLFFSKPKDPKKADSRSVGQLGVGPSKTMRTITLYDGKDPRQKNARNGIVDAAGLEQAARAYAGNAEFAIDISQKGWQDRLKKLQDKNIIDRIMIFDHGWAGNQEFGNEVLKPESEAWKLISSSIKPHGDIVFMGCSVSAEEDHMLTGEHVDGKAYIDSFYLASGRRRPVIRAYNKKVHHAEDKNHLSDTRGEEHSTPSQ